MGGGGPEALREVYESLSSMIHTFLQVGREGRGLVLEGMEEKGTQE
jgi:hypothetical protein